MFDPRGFIRELSTIEMPDGGDIQDLALKYGILESRPLTAADIADENGPWHEYGCGEGESWMFETAAYKAWSADAGEVG